MASDLASHNVVLALIGKTPGSVTVAETSACAGQGFGGNRLDLVRTVLADR
jgi:hypothetical protein